MVASADRRGVVDDVGISASQIGRILADLDLKPHLVRGWLTRPDDPDFADRAIDVCGLYLHQPGDNALVLSVDEKTAIAGPVAALPDQTVPARPRSSDRSSSTAVTAPPV